MEILIILLPLALLLGAIFVASFLWAVGKGQYDDLETPRHRILIEDSNAKRQLKKGNENELVP